MNLSDKPLGINWENPIEEEDETYLLGGCVVLIIPLYSLHIIIYIIYCHK